MAGTVSVTRAPFRSQNGLLKGEKIKIDWVADASDASVPSTEIEQIYGWAVKAITNPGSTAPTDNYDIALKDPDDSSIDALTGLLADRDTSNSEQVYLLVSGAATPIFLAGNYTFALSNNAVNSATGQLILYVVENLR